MNECCRMKIASRCLYFLAQHRIGSIVPKLQKFPVLCLIAQIPLVKLLTTSILSEKQNYAWGNQGLVGTNDNGLLMKSFTG